LDMRTTGIVTSGVIIGPPFRRPGDPRLAISA
jgi:hypothetical protein